MVVSDRHLGDDIEHTLADSGWSPIYARTMQEASDLHRGQGFPVGLVVLPDPHDDIRFEECRRAVFDLRRIRWIATLGRDQTGREAVKRLIVEGLHDFHTFPIDAHQLAAALGHAYGLALVERELQDAEEPAWPSRFGLIGNSPVMRDLYRAIERGAAVDATVLILGATGTGKEQVARSIHAYSARASGPFVALNCAAIPHSLLQSELFGHEKGAFSDACERKVGHIEAAAGGTLLLDEIGDMPLESQASLLRFLDNKEVIPLGGMRTLRVDVRVLASTNRDLERLVRENAFRADLFYRLAVLTIRTPDLHSREGDIEVLAEHFLAEAIAATDNRILGFTAEALSVLRRHNWPGNVRELRSRLFQAALACRGRYIAPEDLDLGASSWAPLHVSLHDALHRTEKQVIESALARSGWNVTRAASDLGISRMTLYRLLEKHGVSRDGDPCLPHTG